MKNNHPPHQPIPHHSAAVEKVAREIVLWGFIAAAICTVIVMLVNV